MKKRNIVGHMMMPRESAGNWFRRWQILPRFLCLIVAIILWLLVVNVTGAKADGGEQSQNSDSAVTEAV